ncbi:MAG TPA: CorA family divalent cation transporter [Gemmatimonadales bacterium]|nr:CorA family divalent cation transporter [Gemmatimonadales bacterium]
MQRTVLASVDPPFEWLDVVNPGRGELEDLARRRGLHATAVQDSLDPEHLPKFERYGTTTFLILRAFDESSAAEAVTVQEMTRKVAVFLEPGLFLTIHRKDQPYLQALATRHAEASVSEGRRPAVSVLLLDLVNAVVGTYARPLEEADTALGRAEDRVFSSEGMQRLLRDLYTVKRRVTTIKRMLWYTLTVLNQLKPSSEEHAPYFQDAKENAESWYVYADELLEQTDSLLQLQFASASHRTNEVIRVLTIFSAFFLPLTFLVGIYGMNFRFMPELEHRWGYPAIWGVMVAVTLAIFAWFRRRGWLR